MSDEGYPNSCWAPSTAVLSRHLISMVATPDTRLHVSLQTTGENAIDSGYSFLYPCTKISHHSDTCKLVTKTPLAKKPGWVPHLTNELVS